MQKAAESRISVDERIERFLAKKAVEYPKIGLAVMNPKTIESTLKPVHEVLADRIVEASGKGFFTYVASLIKSYPAATYSRPH